MISIEVTSRNRMVTLRRNPPRMIFLTDRPIGFWKRMQRLLNRFPLNPTRRHHETLKPLFGTQRGTSNEPVASRNDHLMKQTNCYTWLGFELLISTRYPLTAEESAQWTSPSHRDRSTALRHF